jgi:zinc transport system substrate-binding protein
MMKKITWTLLSVLVIAVMLFPGCTAPGTGDAGSGDQPDVAADADVSADTQADANAGTDAATDGRLNIVATIFPEYDFARAIAGDKADVTLLIDPGSSVHSFDPSPGDLKTISAADIFIYVGGESDEWVDRILDSIDTDSMKVVRLMDHVEMYEEELKPGMEPEEEEEHGDGEDGEAEEEGGEEPEYDEHVWVSPGNALILTDVIADAMAVTDPDNAELYTQNAAKYKEELDRVDAEILEVVSSGARRNIVVADKFPFRYFVERYGLDYAAAFPGCSDQSDAGAQTIAHLIDTVKDGGLPCVYYVELSNRNVANAVAEQTGAEPLLLNSCENISKEDFEKGVTYIDLMDANVVNLRKGLS